MGRKKKKSRFESFFGDFDDIFGFDIPMGEGFSGYSIEIRSTPEGTEVHAKVYGDTDVKALKERLERMYPGAKIVIEGEETGPMIRRVDEAEETTAKEEKVEERGVSITFRGGKPIIMRQEAEERELKKEEAKPTEGIEIIFRKGKPIIKRIE